MKTQFSDPPLAQFVFGDTRMAWFWLVVRLYVGWEWLHAGWGKLNGGWIGEKAGVALSGFIKGALAKTSGAHPDVQGWYGWFISNAVLPYADTWSSAIAIGETLVGVGLLLGVLTGIAAFFGAFMNMNFLLAGTVSINPIIGLLALGIMMAWKVAGYIGADRWLLPLLGTPWRPGRLFSS